MLRVPLVESHCSWTHALHVEGPMSNHKHVQLRLCKFLCFLKQSADAFSTLSCPRIFMLDVSQDCITPKTGHNCAKTTKTGRGNRWINTLKKCLYIHGPSQPQGTTWKNPSSVVGVRLAFFRSWVVSAITESLDCLHPRHSDCLISSLGKWLKPCTFSAKPVK